MKRYSIGSDGGVRPDLHGALVFYSDVVAKNASTDIHMDISALYTQFLQDTAWYIHHGQRNAPEVAYLTLGLVGEAGEFADEIKKIVREMGFMSPLEFTEMLHTPEVATKLRDELGDVLWYLISLAGFLNLTIEELMIHNTRKLYRRVCALKPELKARWPFPHISPEED